MPESKDSASRVEALKSTATRDLSWAASFSALVEDGGRRVPEEAQSRLSFKCLIIIDNVML
jgi:hypothetical protein